jgi:hypothetical protein
MPKLKSEVARSPSPSPAGNSIDECGIVGDVANFLRRFVVMTASDACTIACWVSAAWLINDFDRFPHLCLSSPVKRCGKTTLMELLALLVPAPRPSTNISPAALYRVIAKERPTLLLDEAQSLSRRGSEASEVIREILNAGIGKNARVTRCGGDTNTDIHEFPIYSPKVFALIGAPDGVLRDRCILVELRRKCPDDMVERARLRVIEPQGEELKAAMESWVAEKGDDVKQCYDNLEPFDIANDRMAELLLPLQAILKVAGGDKMLPLLREHADAVDARDRQHGGDEPGLLLLGTLRDIFRAKQVSFMSTASLLCALLNFRTEEPWRQYRHGKPIADEALASLLRPYGIRPAHDPRRTTRGYYAADFADAWARYLPPPEEPRPPRR